MDELGELIASCRAADTDKVTERKRQMAKIQQLLGKSYIVKALDQTSELKAKDAKRGHKLFTWETMFRVAKTLLLHEGEALRKAKEPKSASASTLREKKKLEISSLFKNVFRLANKKHPWLKGGDVVQHVLEVLSDDFLCSVFASDHSSLLFKHILCIRKYWAEITQKTWHELLGQYCILLQNPPGRCERLVIARIVHTVVQGAILQCDMRGKRLLPLLEEYFNNIRNEKNVAVTELMTSTLYSLSQSLASDGRLQVCQLGEKVLPMLIYLWTHRPTDVLKESLVEYFQLQMSCHHPQGAYTEDQGAFAVDWDAWKSNLRRLYEAIYSDYQELRGRNKFATGIREIGNMQLKPNYVQLAADVCHQLFREKSNVLEVTQLSFLQTQPGSAAKKRRVESGWGVLREAIASQGASPTAIPWLQLLTTLLTRYPSSLPEEELLDLLQLLSSATAECRRMEVLACYQVALTALAHSQVALCPPECVLMVTSACWEKIWTMTLRSLTLHLAEESGFSLLSCLLELHLVTPSKDLWMLFLPDICCPSEAAACFLTIYLAECDLPEHHRPALLHTVMAYNSTETFPLRCQLLDWLLPNKAESLDMTTSQSSTVGSSLLGELLVMLTLRDTQMIQGLAVPQAPEDTTAELEQLYLRTSFDTAVAKSGVQQSDTNSRSHDGMGASCIRSLQNKVNKLLHRDTQHLRQAAESEPGTHLRDLIDQCSLLLAVYSSMLRHEVITIDDVPHTALWEPLNALFPALAGALTEEVSSKGVGELAPCVDRILNMFSLAQCGDVAAVVRTVTPQLIIDTLINIAAGKYTLQQTNNNSEGPGGKLSRTLSSRAMEDDFDLDFSTAGGDAFFAEEEAEDEWGESQESEGLKGGQGGCPSLLSPTQLSPLQLCRLQAMRALCHWCDHDTGRNASSIGRQTAGYSSQTVRSKIISLLDPDVWDAAKPYDLQLLQSMLALLTRTSQALSDENIEEIFEALRAVCKSHRRDQELCCVVVEQLTAVVPHLASSEDMASAAEQEAREMALHLLHVFWKLGLDNQYVGRTRRAISKCMQACVQADPNGQWAFWRGKGNSDSNEARVTLLHEDLPKLLKDRQHVVRMQVTEALASLFGDTSGKKYVGHDRSKQEEMFDTIYSILQDVMITEGRYGVDELKDEAVNRVACLLSTLQVVATISPVCEKKAIFAICQMHHEKKLDTNLVKKVLEQLAATLDFPELGSLMEFHLPYLVHQWLESGYLIDVFPHRLIGCSTQTEFYRCHQNVVVPFLLMKKNTDALKMVAASLKMDMANLLDKSMPKILIHILPLFAASKTEAATQDRNVQRQVQHVNSCYELLTSCVPNERVEGQIVSKLDAIVVDLLSTMHDTSRAEGGAHYLRPNDPEPNPPCCTTDRIVATLDYLTQGHSAGVQSVVGLLAKTQDGLQKVLLALRLKLGAQHRMFERRRVLLMYRLFVRLVLKEFHQQLGGSWAFVLRDVLCTLTHMLGQLVPKKDRYDSGCEEYQLASMCVDLLYSVAQVAVEQCPEELGRVLPLLVGAILPYNEQEGELARQCLELLEFVVVTHRSSLKVALCLLDPLPETPVYQRANAVLKQCKKVDQESSLKKELCRFAETSGRVHGGSSCRVSGLHYLAQQLASHKPQLVELMQDQGSGPSDLVLPVIRELLHLASSDNRVEAEAAVQCLGEIGPVRLTAVAMKTESYSPALRVAMEAFRDHPMMRKYCHILHLLDAYLMDASESVVVAASSVLKNILATKTGYAFCTEYKTRIQDTLLHYLYPFRCPKKKLHSLPEQESGEDHFQQCVGVPELWVPKQAGRDQWLQTLSVVLIGSGGVKDEILRLLGPICEVQSKFCAAALPYLIRDILEEGSEVHRDILSQQINHFFEMHCGLSQKAASRLTTPMSGGDVEELVCMDPLAVKTLLNVVQYLRTQTRPVQGRGAKQTAWDNNFWLELDYLKVAKAAHNCGAHFTTILYSEIWCDQQRSVQQLENTGGSERSQSQKLEEEFSQASQWESLRSSIHQADISVQALMLETFRSIGDPDAIYGCGAGKMADTESRIKTYEHENGWAKALGTYDLEVAGPTTSSKQLGMLKALQKFGTSHILSMYLEGLHQRGLDSHEDIQDFQYEVAWRTANWSLDTPNRVERICGSHQALYTGLSAVKQRDAPMLEAALKASRSQAMKQLSSGGLESARSLYPYLGQLLCITQLQDVAECTLLNKMDISHLLEKWEVQGQLLQNDYDFVEPALQLRCTLLKLASSVSGTIGQRARAAHFQHLEILAKASREAGRHQMAERAMHELHCLEESSAEMRHSWKMEEARMYWARGEQETAKHALKELTSNMCKLQAESQEAAQLYPQCLGLYGDWLAQTHSESPNVIMEDYLEKAVELMSEQDTESALDAHLALGRFADTQYQQIGDYMASATYKSKQALAARAREEAEELRKVGEKNTPSSKRDEGRYLRTLEKQSVLDEQELQLMQEDRESFLMTALHNYLWCLQTGDKHDLRVFRVTSLWFDNARNALVNEEIKKSLGKIKSYKFLSLMYQLAARMSTNYGSDGFQRTLEMLLERTVQDHPHHSVYVILALANANRDTEILMNAANKRKSAGRLSRVSQETDSQEQSRQSAAKTLIARLKQSKRAELIEDTDRLCAAYIDLANWDVTRFKQETKPIKIESARPIIQMKNLKNVAVPTRHIPVDPSCQYKDIVYVHKIQDTIKLVGGIHLPKIISCIGSDGVASRQLVKGQDDLRQDAVMQQVFGMVNNLLKKDAGTRNRQLRVRMYKVVPMSQLSGVLEWCEGTLPIGEYLIGPNGAHQRYRPNDLKAINCRKELTMAHQGQPGKSKYKVFLSVCHRFQPVFRHFFMENFSEPAEWYERRLAYTHSVATNSIDYIHSRVPVNMPLARYQFDSGMFWHDYRDAGHIATDADTSEALGYILGLGDRHVQNILVDTKTAELIHIDLGIAFEQGRILPTPETVPFRLTRDLVDGMGVAGVEGVFRRSCEVTMAVMHASQEALLTILQVLLYDPLYAWTISPQRAYMLQQRRDRADPDASDANITRDILDMQETSSNTKESQESVNRVAERVLLRLRQKLQGVEEGVQLSVKGQVNQLIQEARDPKNLCRVFPGWQPYI